MKDSKTKAEDSIRLAYTVLGGLATGYIMACLLKQSEKKSGSRSGYRLDFLALPFVISLRKSEFSWYTVAPKFGGPVFEFPICDAL